ncbi:Calcium-activated potassium channel subunit alpha-1 [Manis javanica]|nr:Calcium-activated potassium channel subunit alpha-1 [Manis javanica]
MVTDTYEYIPLWLGPHWTCAIQLDLAQCLAYGDLQAASMLCTVIPGFNMLCFTSRSGQQYFTGRETTHMRSANGHLGLTGCETDSRDRQRV